jgi:hypothetical protein
MCESSFNFGLILPRWVQPTLRYVPYFIGQSGK